MTIRMTGSRGMTLIEILVVVVILGFLAAVIITVASGIRDSARSSRTEQTVRLTAEAVEAFHTATGYYPLAVPFDAWGLDWTLANGFADTMGWLNRWTDYFDDDGTGKPAYTWPSLLGPDPFPTNIHMLAFQLEQVPESNSVFQRIREAVSVERQRSLDTAGGENWQEEEDNCQLRHPLDNTDRTVYQIQDAWGVPLRYWSSDILEWARLAGVNWPSEVQTVLSTELQAANWGFFVESAGSDEQFGWWGANGAAFTGGQAEDNMYSTGK